MRVLTDEQLGAWISENVPQDPDIYWPERVIRDFERHVLEVHEEQGLVIDPEESPT